jgi:hypothetical protein
VSPVKYELGFYIPEDGILPSHSRENLKSYIALPSHSRQNLKSYIALTGWTLLRRRNASPVKYELGSYIPEDAILVTATYTIPVHSVSVSGRIQRQWTLRCDDLGPR